MILKAAMVLVVLAVLAGALASCIQNVDTGSDFLNEQIRVHTDGWDEPYVVPECAQHFPTTCKEPKR
jgi:hypothetical protein